jgi:hypothetical protein
MSSTWPTSPRSTMVCAQSDLHARSTFVTNRATSCVEINTISKIDQNVFPLDPRHVGVPSVAPKMISKPMVCWTQTCTYLALRLTLSPNILKWSSTCSTPPRSTIWCAEKRFQSLCYIWRKPCTYLVLRLTLSPNGPKQASTSPTSPRSTIRCVQNDFHVYGTFSANSEPILPLD